MKKLTQTNVPGSSKELHVMRASGFRRQMLPACFSQNFWVAITAFAMKILVSGSYLAPAVTMMQNSTTSSNAGLVVSSYAFYSHMAQSLAPLLFGLFAKSFDAFTNPRIYGYLISAFVTVGYLCSNYFYLKAGRAYKSLMEERDK